MSSDTAIADAAVKTSGPSDISDLTWTPAWRLAELIRAKDISPVEVVDHFLERVETLNPTLHGFIYLDAQGARAQAQAAEQAVLKGEALGALHGVPTAVKDHIAVKGGIL